MSAAPRSKKPVIAVDIDEVLFPFLEHLVKHHNEHYGTSFKPSHFDSYEFSEIWGGTRGEAINKVLYFHSIGGSSKGDPIEGAKDALRNLKTRYDFVVITSRQSGFEQQTKAWLSKHFLNLFRDVHFASYWFEGEGEKLTKVSLCKQLGASCMIDDSLEYVLECAEKGIKGILFGDYPWNQADKLPEGVVRAKDWAEVERILL